MTPKRYVTGEEFIFLHTHDVHARNFWMYEGEKNGKHYMHYMHYHSPRETKVTEIIWTYSSELPASFPEIIYIEAEEEKSVQPAHGPYAVKRTIFMPGN